MDDEEPPEDARARDKRTMVPWLIFLAVLVGPLVAARNYESDARASNLAAYEALLHGAGYLLGIGEPEDGTSIAVGWIAMAIALTVLLGITHLLYRNDPEVQRKHAANESERQRRKQARAKRRATAVDMRTRLDELHNRPSLWRRVRAWTADTRVEIRRRWNGFD